MDIGTILITGLLLTGAQKSAKVEQFGTFLQVADQQVIDIEKIKPTEGEFTFDKSGEDFIILPQSDKPAKIAEEQEITSQKSQDSINITSPIIEEKPANIIAVEENNNSDDDLFKDLVQDLESVEQEIDSLAVIDEESAPDEEIIVDNSQPIEALPNDVKAVITEQKPTTILGAIANIEAITPIKRPWADYMIQNLPPVIHNRTYNYTNSHLPSAVFQHEYMQAVFVAIKQNNIDALRALLQRVDNLEDLTINGMTPVIYALNFSNLAMVKFLMTQSTNINKADMAGHTALHVATLLGRLDAVIELLLWGAEVNDLTPRRESSLDIAYNQGRYDIAGVLQKAGGISNIAVIQAANNTDSQHAMR